MKKEKMPREIIIKTWYHDKKKWTKNISNTVFALTYGYNFEYYYDPLKCFYYLNNNEPQFTRDFIKKLDMYPIYHQMTLFRVAFRILKDTNLYDMYALVVFKSKTIEVYVLNSDYSDSNKNSSRYSAAKKFIKAFNKAYKDAVTAREQDKDAITKLQTFTMGEKSEQKQDTHK